jgi:para-nitrobenzyl esterase
MTAAQAPIPLLAGTARDETRLFELLPGPRQLPQDRADVARLLYEQAPEQADNILAAYPDTKAGGRALATDATFAINTRHFAERHAATQPVWFYRLDAANPVLGALHGIDCTYFWDFTGPLFAALRGGPLIGRRKALATRMQQHIVNFVRDGAPDPAWPCWSESGDSTRIYDVADRFVEGLDAARRRAWAGVDLLSCGMPPGQADAGDPLG